MSGPTHHLRRLFRALWLSAAATLAAGCSTYQSPSLAVRDVRVAEQSEDGAVLAFTLDATNPNQVGLPLVRVRYDVSLDGRQVFSGVRSPEATLRRRGTQQIVIPAAIPLDGGRLPEGPVRYRIDGRLQYITPGEFGQILFDLGVARPSVAFSDEGVAELTAPHEEAALDAAKHAPRR